MSKFTLPLGRAGTPPATSLRHNTTTTNTTPTQERLSDKTQDTHTTAGTPPAPSTGQARSRSSLGSVQQPAKGPRACAHTATRPRTTRT